MGTVGDSDPGQRACPRTHVFSSGMLELVLLNPIIVGKTKIKLKDTHAQLRKQTVVDGNDSYDDLVINDSKQ